MKPEMKETYLANPHGCVVCRSENYTTVGSTYDGAFHWVYLECNECLAKWHEEYKMVDVHVEEYES